MKLIKSGEPQLRPELLKPGQRVALISPSSHMGDAAEEQLGEAVEILKSWELEIEPLPEIEPRHLYFAGNDQERLAQFQSAYLNPEIKALFFTRGGYGATRILPMLDQALMKGATPKPIVGFSDATAVFCWMGAMTGVAGLHGPCLAAPSLLRSETREEDLAALHQALFDEKYRPEFDLKSLNQRVPQSAEVEGVLIGGCLAVLVTTLGTPWEIDTTDKVLFLEDIGEAPYRVDRMLAHMRGAGKLDSVKAVVFGHMSHCDSDPEGLLLDVLLDFFANDSFPIAIGMKAGHGSPNNAIWLGQNVNVTMDGEGAGKLRFL